MGAFSLIVVINLLNREIMVQVDDKTTSSETVTDAEATELRQQLSEVRSEFVTICSEVQQIQQQQKQMALQFQSQMQKLVGLIQMAQSASQPQNAPSSDSQNDASK